MRLDNFSAELDRGASRVTEALWLAANGILVSSWLPGSGWRVWVLRAFGAQIGQGVVIKPGVRIKFPWKLSVGDYSWIGEAAWIDNLANVRIGSHACLSQGAYLCTGSHDWGAETFDLIVKPITLNDRAWVAAKATVGPGVIVGEGAVLGLGSTAAKDLEPWGIYSGTPAQRVRKRLIIAAVPA